MLAVLGKEEVAWPGKTLAGLGNPLASGRNHGESSIILRPWDHSRLLHIPRDIWDPNFKPRGVQVRANK